MDQNEGGFFMRDMSESDPRSVKAWLRGKGDGRTEAFNRYRREALARDPSLTDEKLTEDYEAYVRLSEQKRAWRDRTVNPMFSGYGRAFLGAFRAREDAENALEQAADRHPGQIYNRGFDSVMTHLGGGLVMAFIFYGIWHIFS
jgi:hypothetical protein